MDIVLIFNGLGNQMSQYAFYLAKKQLGHKCMLLVDETIVSQHNGFELNRIFQVGYHHSLSKKMLWKAFQKIQFSTRLGNILRGLGFKIIREEENYNYNPNHLNPGKGLLNYYKGGWHCENYFYSLRNDIREIFKFDENLMNEKTLKMRDMINKSAVSVSLHVRRGDYLKKPWGIYDFSQVATESYYERAIAYVKENNQGPITFFVFSDDVLWCKQNFKGHQFVYVDFNKGEDSWQDMYLMTCCIWHINANSSFSWWGAWLSEYPENTIVPNRFLRKIDTPDIYPDIWKKIK